MKYNHSDNASMTAPDLTENGDRPVFFMFIIPFLIVYLSIWIGKLVWKYFFNSEPVHIVSINCLIDYLLTDLMVFLIRINNYFDVDGFFCAVVEFLSDWSKVVTYQGFSLMELDRFLALYWNLLYYERVTNQRTFNFILMVKFSSLLVFSAYFWFTDLFHCHVPCYFVEIKSFYPIVISQSLYIASTIVVCIYVFNMARKHQNDVVPVFIVGQNQNEPEVETPQSNIAKLTKIGLKVNILSLIQLIPECPRVIVSVFFYVHNYSCDDDSDDNILVYVLHVLSLISAILVPILINRKLNHYSLN